MPTMEEPDERPLTTAEVAEAFDVDRRSVLNWVSSGHLVPAYRAGENPKAGYLFDRAEVERLRKIRDGEAGDVIDRVDLDAASKDPLEDRNARIRANWLQAIETVSKRTGGTFHTGQLRPHLTDEAQGHAPGALISGLRRRKVIEPVPGAFDTLGDSRNRHAESPCKVYRVVGVLS